VSTEYYPFFYKKKWKLGVSNLGASNEVPTYWILEYFGNPVEYGSVQKTFKEHKLGGTFVLTPWTCKKVS
jgi:hypothetical protein